MAGRASRMRGTGRSASKYVQHPSAPKMMKVIKGGGCPDKQMVATSPSQSTPDICRPEKEEREPGGNFKSGADPQPVLDD